MADRNGKEYVISQMNSSQQIKSEEETFPKDWINIPLKDLVEFSRKSHSIRIGADELLPFIPMDYISDSSDEIKQWETKRRDEISSGTFICKNDLIVAKITPSFENGKQAILSNLPTEYGYATTEVWAFHPRKDNLIIDFVSYYLRIPLVRAALTSKMEGSTNRQRLPREVLENLMIPLPPLPEQRAIVHILRNVQMVKEKTEEVIEAANDLKASMMTHLFTYGPVSVSKKEQVMLKTSDIGLVPEGWKSGRLDEFMIFQRGFDITKKDQKEGRIPVISSSGVKSYHNVWKVKGPGVVIGRKGTLGSFFYNESDFWPHDTTLWVKEFKNNCPKFVFYFIPTLKLEKLDTGTSNPTLNRNYVHMINIAFPQLKEQKVIVDIFEKIDNKIAAEEQRKKALDHLLKSLLHNLMGAKVRVNDRY